MIKVKSEVRLYDENTETQEEKLTVSSHWNQNELVGLDIGGRVLYVVAKDLEAAIKNATNSARF